MTETRHPLAVFDDDAFDRVAAGSGVDADRLRTLARRHQEGVRDLPGVDDIVYEWRNHFHLDPLVHRSERAYVLALPGHVWNEFADRLDATGPELDALQAVHDSRARELAGPTDRFESDDALVLVRP